MENNFYKDIEKMDSENKKLVSAEKELFNCFLNDKFTSEFLDYYNYKIVTSITIIGDCCHNLMLKRTTMSRNTYFKYMNLILRSCNQMRLMSYLQVMIEDAGCDEEFPDVVMEANDFFKSFAKRCNELLEGVCKIKIKESDTLYIKCNKIFLRYLLLVNLRKALYENAKSITVSFAVEDDEAVIKMDIKRRPTPPDNDFKDFDIENDVHMFYFKEINDLISKKMKCSVEVGEDIVIIRTPINDGIYMNAKEKLPEDVIFNVYNSLLAEFGNYKYFI